MAVRRSGYDAQRRPDPITPKATVWTVLAAIAGALVSAAIDTGWHLPESNKLMDWVRSILILLFAVGGARVGARQAKKETTPLLDPRDEFLRRLVPVGTRPDTPDGDPGGDPAAVPLARPERRPQRRAPQTFNSVYGQDAAGQDAAGVSPADDPDPGGDFFDQQGDRGEHDRSQYPGYGPGDSPGRL